MQRLGQFSSKRLSIRAMAYIITGIILGFSGLTCVIIYQHLLHVAKQADEARYGTIPLALRQHEIAVDVRQLELYMNLIADSRDPGNSQLAQQRVLQLQQTIRRQSPPAAQAVLDELGEHLHRMLAHSQTRQQHEKKLRQLLQDADHLMLSTNILLDAISTSQAAEAANGDLVFLASRLQYALMTLRTELGRLTALEPEAINDRQLFFQGMMQVSNALHQRLQAIEADPALADLLAGYAAFEEVYTLKTALQNEQEALNTEARAINGLLATLSRQLTSNANELANRGADEVAANARKALTIAIAGFGVLALVFIITLAAVRYEIIRPIILAGFSLHSLSTGKPKIRLAKTDLREIDAINAAVRDFARAMDEKEQANQRLVSMAQMKAAFTSSVSHELRTPLTSIRGFIKLAHRDFNRYFSATLTDATLQKKATQISSNLEIVMKESERLSLLIDDVLDIAKIESGRMTWRDSLTDVGEIILRSQAALAGEFLQRKDIRLHLTISPTLPKIVIDPDKLLQVLLNLLNNALKFTTQGEITVEAHADEQAVHIRVSDTGQGIAADDLEVIFEKFQQGRQASLDAAKPKGTGLGLAICKQIIEHYGGRISVTSELGAGSTFHFHLPIQGGNADA